jgi:predicted ATPase with chaperone activity
MGPRREAVVDAESRVHGEEEKVTISQAMNSSIFPADLILVAAMNPCPWVCAKDHRAIHAGTNAGRGKGCRIR